jgi:RHS repeat-associated protein
MKRHLVQKALWASAFLCAVAWSGRQLKAGSDTFYGIEGGWDTTIVANGVNKIWGLGPEEMGSSDCINDADVGQGTLNISADIDSNGMMNIHVPGVSPDDVQAQPATPVNAGDYILHPTISEWALISGPSGNSVDVYVYASDFTYNAVGWDEEGNYVAYPSPPNSTEAIALTNHFSLTVAAYGYSDDWYASVRFGIYGEKTPGSSGSESNAPKLGNPEEKKPPTSCPDGAPDSNANGNAGSAPSAASPTGANYGDGMVSHTETGIGSQGLGTPTGTNTSLSVLQKQTNGYGWTNPQVPVLARSADGNRLIVKDRGDAWKSYVSGSPQPYYNSSLAADTTNHLYVETKEDGTVTKYNDYTQSTYPKGSMSSSVDRYGNTNTATYSSGHLSKITRASGASLREEWNYTYLTSGVNSGLLSTVSYRRSTDGGTTWGGTIRQVAYTYYNGTEDYGSQNDLKLVQIKDGSGNVLDTRYYRYWKLNEGDGLAHSIRAIVGPESYERTKAWATAHSIVDPTTVSDSDLISDSTIAYDVYGRAWAMAVSGAGCSCSGNGVGSYSYAYESNGNTIFSTDMNEWRTKTTEDMPDGTENVIFTNNAGLVILRIDDVNGTPRPTYAHYDSAGRLLWKAETSAFVQVSGAYYDQTRDDLLNFSTGNSPYLSDSAGLLHVYAYGPSTTATSSTAGDVVGYSKSEGVRHGETGSDILISSQNYVSRSAGGSTSYHVASTTLYRNTNGTGGMTTSYAYTWFSGTHQMASRTTTKPVITTGQNGPGGSTGDQTAEYSDQFGNVVWTKDPAGYITYTGWDALTGAMAKMVVDVDTSQTGDFLSGDSVPSGWSSISGTRLRLANTYELDDLGRTTKLTDARGNITYTVFKDTDHEVRTYPGWDTTSSAPTGPTQVSREDRAGNYREMLTMSATPSVSSSRPTGAESIGSVESLSRTVLDLSGRPIYGDRYFNLNGVTYSASSVTLGTLDTNYYRSATSYDSAGRVDRALDGLGTITRTIFDSAGRPSSTWIGTDDTPTSGDWSPSNTPGTNLTKISENQYDGGSVGDGNLTQVTLYPGTGSNRVTAMFYDWRDRRIATKSGVSVSETDGVHRPITLVDLDNLGQVTATYRYDGDGESVTVSSGVVSVSASTKLRAKSTAAYDEQGRVYEAKTFSVAQSNGTVSTDALTSLTWYDSRGNVIKSSQPGGLISKNAYDGVGRLTVSSTTDGGSDSGYSDASTLTGDAVLEQVLYTYNKNGAPVLTVSKARNHDETTTGALGDQSTTPKARVTYTTSFYDKADRTLATAAYGTNGGTSVSAPSESDSVPTRSDTILVTSITYTSAGLADEVTDPKAVVNKTYHDNAGRTTKTIAAYTNGTPTDSSNQTTLYTYDGADHVRTLTADMPSGTNDQVTEYVYGVTTGGGSDLTSNSLLVTVKYPNKSTGAASTSASEQNSFSYNALGQARTRTDQNATVQTYSYDVLGRLTANSAAVASGNPQNVNTSVLRLETAYNTAGQAYLFTSYNAASAGSVVNQVQRAYNGLGQLITEYQAHGGSVNTSTSPKVQYAYSEMASSANHSRLQSMTYPNGRTLRYEYSSGLDTTISRLSFLADDTSGSVGTHLEEYSYLGASIVIKRAHPQPGVDLTYMMQSGESAGDAGDQYTGLDRFGRVVDQRWIATSGGSHTDRFQYGYDRDSNRLYKNNLVASAQSELYHANGSGNGYDVLSRLTDFRRGTLTASGSVLDTVSTASRTQAWTLDALGNMPSVSTNGTSESRTHNSQNQITAIASTSTFSDNNGSLTNDGTRSYLYDIHYRLTEVKDAAGTNSIIMYAYDALGRRITESPNGGAATDVYYSASWQALEDVQSSHAKNQYVWSPVYIDAMIERDRDADNDGSHTLEERLYAEHDANFNLTSVINTSGTVLERYFFDPYGDRTVTDANCSSRAGNVSSFTWMHGHQGLKGYGDDGLLCARSRVLSPNLHRLLQIDSIGYADGLNLYEAFGNNPIIRVDPKGTQFTPTVTKLGAVQMAQLYGADIWGWTDIGVPQVAGVDRVDEKQEKNGCWSARVNQAQQINVQVNTDIINSLTDAQGVPIMTQSGLDAVASHEQRRRAVYEKAYNEYLKHSQEKRHFAVRCGTICRANQGEAKGLLEKYLQDMRDQAIVQYMAYAWPTKQEQIAIGQEMNSAVYKNGLLVGIAPVHKIASPPKFVPPECPTKK